MAWRSIGVRLAPVQGWWYWVRIGLLAAGFLRSGSIMVPVLFDAAGNTPWPYN